MTAEFEEDVARLRKEHATADGEERSKIAILLGLAISDLVADLPSDDSRLPGLAEEGMLRLDEGTASAAPTWTAAIEQGKEVLEGKLRLSASVHLPPAPAAAMPTGRPWPPQGRITPTLDELLAINAQLTGNKFGPDAFTSQDGNWAGMAGAYRTLMEAFRPFVLGGPEGDPLRVLYQSFMGTLDILEALDSGQWRAQHDQALADMRQAATHATAADGSGITVSSGLVLAFAALMRGRRYLSIIIDSPGEGDQPEPTVLDEVIADLEAAVTRLDGTPIDGLVSVVRLVIDHFMLARVALDARDAGRPSRSSFDRAIGLLRRAQDHVVEMPPVLADQFQPLLLNIRKKVAALERARGAADDAGGDGGEPLAPVVAPKRTVDLPDKELPAPPAIPEAATEKAGPQSSPARAARPSGVDVQHHLGAVVGMRLLLPLMQDEDPRRSSMRIRVGLVDALEAMMSGRWMPKHDLALAELRQVADGGEGIDRSNAAFARVALAMARFARCETMMQSPRSEDWPDATELSEVVAELEAVLDVLPDADLPPDIASPPIRAMAGLLLMRLGQLAEDQRGGDKHDHKIAVQLAARAFDHLAKAPPEFFAGGDRGVAEFARLQRLLNGMTRPDPAQDRSASITSTRSTSRPTTFPGCGPWLTMLGVPKIRRISPPLSAPCVQSAVGCRLGTRSTPPCSPGWLSCCIGVLLAPTLQRTWSTGSMRQSRPFGWPRGTR
jgi:hypothetical protein